MRNVVVFALFGLLVQPLPAVAQALAPGKYTGHIAFLWMGKPVQEMVRLTIDKVEGNQSEGTAWVGTKLCSVDTPVRGEIEGDMLKVRGKAVKENCGIRWDLKVSGSTLEGTTPNGSTLRLSR